MNWLELFIRLAGLVMIILSLAHVFYGRRLGWNEELSKVNLLTRQVFYVHMFFVCLTLIWMGAVALVFPTLLLAPSTLAFLVNSGIALFWLARLLIQWFGYSPLLWRGKVFETRVHWLFTILWSYLTLVFGWATWAQWTSLT